MAHGTHFPRRTFSLLAAVGSGEILAACSDAPSTGGQRIVLGCRVLAEALEFSNSYGATLSLERVLVSIGPLRYLEGLPIARRSLFGVRLAHAHPGHYLAGGVLGEMLSPTSVELVQGETLLPSGPGVTGAAHSAQFSFQAPVTGPYAEELGDNVVLIRGIARTDDTTTAFEAAALLEDVVDASGAPWISGCELHGGPIRADGLVTLTLRPSVWLDQVDFAALPASAPGEHPPFVRAGTAQRAFARGLKKAAAYRFTYTPNDAL